MLGYLEDYNKTIPVLEIYTAIQSEGSRAGYPTIVVRTTGCTHRCFFGEGGWCDSWYTSIHPEKGKYSFNDIVKAYDDNPHIKEMMLTGGAPTMHPKLVNTLTKFAQQRNIVVTMETEGSHFLATEVPIDLISLSPKFSNSVPQLGAVTPQGSDVSIKMIEQHNKFRLNIPAIARTISYHGNFHIKPVIDSKLSIAVEFGQFIRDLAKQLESEDNEYRKRWHQYSRSEIIDILQSKVWCMPAGDTREALLESYPVVMEYAIRKGYNFSPRPHIIAYDTRREV
jgi:7-carboxy-7-deazaguanine synthase